MVDYLLGLEVSPKSMSDHRNELYAQATRGRDQQRQQ